MRSSRCPRVSESGGCDRPTIRPSGCGRAAEILNVGEKVALLVGQGAFVTRRTSWREVADLLGAGAAKALLGKDVLPDALPWVTGSIGLLGTTAKLSTLCRIATRC